MKSSAQVTPQIAVSRLLQIRASMLQARHEDTDWKDPLNPPPGSPTDADSNFLPLAQWKNRIPFHSHPPCD